MRDHPGQAEPPSCGLSGPDAALLEVLALLRERGYAFVTPTNATLRTIRGRPEKHRAAGLRDVFGWSLPFEERLVGAALFEQMRAAGILEPAEHGWVSRLRVSSLEGMLFLHSAFPTAAEDAVFFGPDTYRYARVIKARLPELAPGAVIVDVGAGSGPGGILAGKLRPQARVLLADVNPEALRLARLNARFAGVEAECVQGQGLEAAPAALDLVIANPPFIAEREGSTYQHGGGLFGGEIALAWVEAALPRLKPGGRMLLYTGAAVAEGEDVLLERLQPLAERSGCSLAYEELDPDIFGSELRRSAYQGVDRIAAVAAEIVRPAAG